MGVVGTRAVALKELAPGKTPSPSGTKSTSPCPPDDGDEPEAPQPSAPHLARELEPACAPRTHQAKLARIEGSSATSLGGRLAAPLTHSATAELKHSPRRLFSRVSSRSRRVTPKRVLQASHKVNVRSCKVAKTVKAGGPLWRGKQVAADTSSAQACRRRFAQAANAQWQQPLRLHFVKHKMGT